MSTFWDFFANNGQWVPSFPIAPAGSAEPGSWCSAVARVAHHVDVFWVAPNGAIMTTFWDAFFNAGRWVAPFTIAGPGSASPTARLTSLARLSHTINVFWATPAGAVESVWWDTLSNKGQWKGPVTLAPDGSAMQDAAIDSVARVPHHVDVFWDGPDDTIRTIWWDQFVNNGNWIPSFVLP